MFQKRIFECPFSAFLQGVMSYRPHLPDSVGASRSPKALIDWVLQSLSCVAIFNLSCVRRWVRFLPILFAAIAVGWVYLTSETFVNPETGRKAHVGLSEAQEEQLGLQSFREVVSHSSIVQSGPAYDVVRRVASRLVRVLDTGSEQYQWQVAVVQNPAQKAVQIAMMGIQGSMSDLDPQAQRQLLGMLGAGAQYGVLLPFSRKHELEADQIGLTYMARAGYDPRESVAFWKRMMAASQGGKPPEFMSTHPADQTRINQLEQLMPAALEIYQKAVQQ